MMMMVMKHKLGRKSRWREICRLGKQLREKKESRRGVVEDRGFNWPLQQWNNGDKLVFFSLFNQQLTTTWRRWPGLRCADDICSPRDMVTFWVIDYYKRNTHTHRNTRTSSSVGDEGLKRVYVQGSVTEWGPGCRKSEQDRFLHPTSISSPTLIILTLSMRAHTHTHTLGSVFARSPVQSMVCLNKAAC